MNWVRVSDRLPDEPGWYLVFAPTYSGGSSGGLECIDGIMFSKLRITKAGKKSWSIEVGYHERPGCVLYWAPLPFPTQFGHFGGLGKDKFGAILKVWVDDSGIERALP